MLWLLVALPFAAGVAALWLTGKGRVAPLAALLLLLGAAIFVYPTASMDDLDALGWLLLLPAAPLAGGIVAELRALRRRGNPLPAALQIVSSLVLLGLAVWWAVDIVGRYGAGPAWLFTPTGWPEPAEPGETAVALVSRRTFMELGAVQEVTIGGNGHGARRVFEWQMLRGDRLIRDEPVTVTPEQMAALINEFRQAEFFALRPTYIPPNYHVSTVNTLSLTIGKRTKTVVYAEDLPVPKALVALGTDVLVLGAGAPRRR